MSTTMCRGIGGLMVVEPAAQWAFSVLFAALAAYSMYRLVIDRRRPLLVVGHTLHLLMAVGMAAMVWPSWTHVPAAPQLVVFTAGAGWFLTLAALQVRGTVSPRALAGHGPGQQVGHAVMMLAMVWMTAAMIGTDVQAGSTHAHGAMPALVALPGVAATAALLVTGVVLIVEFVAWVRGRGHIEDAAPGALMSLGMAAMCWLMLAM